MLLERSSARAPGRPTKRRPRGRVLEARERLPLCLDRRLEDRSQPRCCAHRCAQAAEHRGVLLQRALGGEHALERDLRARLHALQRVALVVPTLGHELLRATNLDDGVPAGRRAGRGGSVEADLVHRGLDRGCERRGKGKTWVSEGSLKKKAFTAARASKSRSILES